MIKFRGKYRIESNRLQGWDYAGNGTYFITLVTNNRECNLGHIENEKMVLSDFGKIVESEWLKSFEIRNELILDEYIIMPNHLHAIVILDKTKNDTDGYTADMDGFGGAVVVEAHGRAPLPSAPSTIPNADQPSAIPPPNPTYLHRKPESISSFVGGFKSAINTRIDDFIDENHLDIPKYNRNNHFFQPNYHDHIIRNHDEYLRIKKYIIQNPKKWKDDSLNKV